MKELVINIRNVENFQVVERKIGKSEKNVTDI